MENTSYYFEGEGLVFLTKEYARDYFFKEELYNDEANYFCLNEFLINMGYNCEDIFLFDKTEKENILTDYREALFKSWVNDELIECSIYTNSVKGCK